MQSRIYDIRRVEIEALIVVPESLLAVMVSAEGRTVTTGWSQPSLAPWMYIQPPKDGILDLDFVATPPTGFVIQVLTKIAVATAFPIPDWFRGVRVHSAQNSVEALLSKADIGRIAPLGEGLPMPWPFPWWAPKAKA